MTYRVEKEQGRYQVIEKDTDLVIQHMIDESEARELCRALNLGSGFNGFTPTFFSHGSKQKERPPTE